MTNTLVDDLKETEAVYYSQNDYAGFTRRFIILIVDGVVIFLMIVILAAILEDA